MIIIIYIVLLVATLLLTLFVGYTVYAIVTGAPFVPTFPQNVERMIRLAKLRPGETLMDLGSGDGRILRVAAKSGLTCIGIEINPILYWWSRFRNWVGGYTTITVRREDLWKTNLQDVDVLTLFFMAPKMAKLKEKIFLEMKRGTRVVSYGFRFPDWQYADRDDKVYLYVVDSTGGRSAKEDAVPHPHQEADSGRAGG